MNPSEIHSNIIYHMRSVNIVIVLRVILGVCGVSLQNQKNNCIIVHELFLLIILSYDRRLNRNPLKIFSLAFFWVEYALHRRLTGDGWSYTNDFIPGWNWQQNFNISSLSFFINVKGWVCVPEEALNTSPNC